MLDIEIGLNSQNHIPRDILPAGSLRLLETLGWPTKDVSEARNGSPTTSLVCVGETRQPRFTRDTNGGGPRLSTGHFARDIGSTSNGFSIIRSDTSPLVRLMIVYLARCRIHRVLVLRSVAGRGNPAELSDITYEPCPPLARGWH